MLNQSMNRNQIGVLGTGRRRSGGWMLAGWLAFWLTTVLAPCCRSLAAESGPSGPVPVMQAAEPTAHSSASHAHAALPDFDCQDLTALDPGAPPIAVTTGAERFDLVTAAVGSPELYLSGSVRALPVSRSWHHPPPGAPLYLRTQRLRI